MLWFGLGFRLSFRETGPQKNFHCGGRSFLLGNREWSFCDLYRSQHQLFGFAEMLLEAIGIVFVFKLSIPIAVLGFSGKIFRPLLRDVKL